MMGSVSVKMKPAGGQRKNKRNRHLPESDHHVEAYIRAKTEDRVNPAGQAISKDDQQQAPAETSLASRVTLKPLPEIRKNSSAPKTLRITFTPKDLIKTSGKTKKLSNAGTGQKTSTDLSSRIPVTPTPDSSQKRTDQSMPEDNKATLLNTFDAKTQTENSHTCSTIPKKAPNGGEDLSAYVSQSQSVVAGNDDVWAGLDEWTRIHLQTQAQTGYVKCYEQ